MSCFWKGGKVEKKILGESLIPKTMENQASGMMSVAKSPHSTDKSTDKSMDLLVQKASPVQAPGLLLAGLNGQNLLSEAYPMRSQLD